jgi:hypothetical protein
MIGLISGLDIHKTLSGTVKSRGCKADHAIGLQTSRQKRTVPGAKLIVRYGLDEPRERRVEQARVNWRREMGAT